MRERIRENFWLIVLGVFFAWFAFSEYQDGEWLFAAFLVLYGGGVVYAFAKPTP